MQSVQNLSNNLI